MTFRRALAACVLLLSLVSTSGSAQQPSANARPGKPGTVLVTGSNRGLGLEFVRQYAAGGWDVIATARNPEAAPELRELAMKSGRVTIEKLDVLDRAAIAALAAKYAGRPVDLLINNAGVLGEMKAQVLGSLDSHGNPPL